MHQIAWIQVKNVQKCSRARFTLNGVNRMTGVSYFCPYLRVHLIRNVPLVISTTFYRYSIIYYILLSALYTIQADPTRPTGPGATDPAQAGPTRHDPGPTRLHSTPDSSQNEGRITRPRYPISTAQSPDSTTPRWNNSRGKPNSGERRKIEDIYRQENNALCPNCRGSHTASYKGWSEIWTSQSYHQNPGQRKGFIRWRRAIECS